MVCSCLSELGGEMRGAAAPHSIAPLLRPWRRHTRPGVFPLSCSAYDNIRLLSLAGFRDKPAVLARIIKGPLKMDAILFPEKKKQTNEFISSLFFSGLLPIATPKARTLLSKNTVNIKPLKGNLWSHIQATPFSHFENIY